jgi:hypothetical protein
VPRGHASTVVEAVQQLQEREQKRIAEIRAGQVVRGDVDELLRGRGVIE